MDPTYAQSFVGIEPFGGFVTTNLTTDIKGNVLYFEVDGAKKTVTVVFSPLLGVPVDAVRAVADGWLDRPGEKAFLTDATIGVQDSSLVAKLGLNLAPDPRRSNSNSLTDDELELLARTFNPIYKLRVSSMARAVRDGAGRHFATRITLHILSGSIDAGKVSGTRVDGMDRAQVRLYNIVFSMERPSYNQTVIDDLVREVCEAIGAYWQGTTHITDDDPDAQLHSCLDWVDPNPGAGKQYRDPIGSIH